MGPDGAVARGSPDADRPPLEAVTTRAKMRDAPMNPMTLFLTQLLPLLVFIVVDCFVTDVRISICSAILFAIGQLVVTYVRNHRFEWFVLLDVGLIAGLGAISIAFENELFFKVKPAIMDGVGIVFTVALIVAPSRFLLAYFGRMMPRTVLKPETVGTLKSMLAMICLGTAVHIGLVLYTAFRSSKEVWAFVSGPGFYLIILPMVAVVGIAQRRQKAQQAPATQREPLCGAATEPGGTAVELKRQGEGG